MSSHKRSPATITIIIRFIGISVMFFLNLSFQVLLLTIFIVVFALCVFFLFCAKLFTADLHHDHVHHPCCEEVFFSFLLTLLVGSLCFVVVVFVLTIDSFIVLAISEEEKKKNKRFTSFVIS